MLDLCRWTMLHGKLRLGGPVVREVHTVGRITKWVKKYQKAKEIFVDGYQEDLGKYPVKVESSGKSGGSKGVGATKKG